MIGRKKKRIAEAQARDAILEQMTDEERIAWNKARLQRGKILVLSRSVEAVVEAALAEGVKYGQRIAIDVSYQEKMSTFVYFLI